MGLEEKAIARERRGPENGVKMFFLINEPVWTGVVRENMDGFEEGLPWIRGHIEMIQVLSISSSQNTVSPRLEGELTKALLPL